ncbi:MAG TPA: hypothetical protein VM680_05270 [Verrucomicrobiae bacterium]|nr:hypothetical protein [Verrucomicrobiae bacterium]
MKFNWKRLRLAVTATTMFVAVGCGGLNGSYNISPATFLLPGIGQVTPASTNAPNHTVTVAVVQ